jgi:glycosyltransferase involved in cell wall biosynthesis
MKIGIVTDSIRDKSTGIGFYARDVVRRLLEMDKTDEYVFIDYLTTEFNQNRLLKINNPFSYFKTYLWHNYLPTKIRKTDVDVVLNFSAVPHVVPFKCKELFFVYDISWYLYPEYHPKSRVLFYKTFFRQCLRNSHKIVVDSSSAKDDLVKIFSVPEDKIHIIFPPFTDTINTIDKIKYDISTPYILFIGTLEPRKNIESIIKAFKKLKDKKQVPHKLVICGKKGWMYNRIFTLIKELDLDEDIIYLGYISNEEKKYLYLHAEFFVYPSFYEGFGIPVLEAMTYGCPVITSNVSSLPEVVGKAGLQVDPKNVDALASEMDMLISDEKLRNKMKHDGFAQVKILENKKQIQALLPIITNL